MPDEKLDNIPGAVGVQQISYASAPVGRRYQLLRVSAAKPIYFPDVCCECLTPTTTHFTMRGNRIRYRSLAGKIVAVANDESDFFELRMPICNRCWRGFLKRQNQLYWVGPLIGAVVGLVIGAFPIIDAIRYGDPDRYGLFAFAMGATLVMAIIGCVITVKFAAALASPPAKVHAYFLRAKVGIRFKNPGYVELFQAAQIEVPKQLALYHTARADPGAFHWYFIEQGETTGPLTFDDLLIRVAEGKLGPDDQVWTEGLPGWIAASQLQGLFEIQ